MTESGFKSIMTGQNSRMCLRRWHLIKINVTSRTWLGKNMVLKSKEDEGEVRTEWMALVKGIFTDSSTNMSHLVWLSHSMDTLNFGWIHQSLKYANKKILFTPGILLPGHTYLQRKLTKLHMRKTEDKYILKVICSSWIIIFIRYKKWVRISRSILSSFYFILRNMNYNTNNDMAWIIKKSNTTFSTNVCFPPPLCQTPLPTPKTVICFLLKTPFQFLLSLGVCCFLAISF